MNLSQLYVIMGWPLRFWRTKTLPPQPVAHNIPFSEAMRSSHEPEDLIGIRWAWLECKKDDPEEAKRKRALENEEFRERCRAMDARYTSLKQGEELGRLTIEERRELLNMETGNGWCLDLTNGRQPERLGQRRACFPL